MFKKTNPSQASISFYYRKVVRAQKQKRKKVRMVEGRQDLCQIRAQRIAQ